MGYIQILLTMNKQISPLLIPEISTNTTNLQKIDWVDYAKGIGIFLVVFGHTLIGLVNGGIITPSEVSEFVEKFIYSFHMPLFFFISGLFGERSLKKTLSVFFQNKLQVIVYPYLVWSVLQTGMQLIASPYTNQPPTSWMDILRIGYQPIMQFWFLYTLFFILCVYAVWRKVCKLSPVSFLIFSAVIYCLHVFDVSFGPWGVLYLFRRHAIYFALGVILGNSKFLPKLSHIKDTKLILATIMSLAIIAFTIHLQISNNGLIIPVVAIYGITASLAIAIFLSRYQWVHFVKNWGILSLEIFVAHSIASSVFRNLLAKLLQIHHPTIHLIIGTLIGIYIPIYLDQWCRKIGFPYLFTLRDRRASTSVIS